MLLHYLFAIMTGIIMLRRLQPFSNLSQIICWLLYDRSEKPEVNGGVMKQSHSDLFSRRLAEMLLESLFGCHPPKSDNVGGKLTVNTLQHPYILACTCYQYFVPYDKRWQDL
jgi:hypothetical protein